MNKFPDLKNIKSGGSFFEYAMTLALTALTFISRFLAGAYKPVMDDWFLYGDLYKTIPERISQFAIPNEKFAIRPAAGFFDCFINAPLFEHLWLIELILTLALICGAFLIMRTARRNGVGGAGFLLCLMCLYPVSLEATYWIAAATRVSYSVLFIGAAVFSLDYYFETRKKRGLILFTLLGLISTGFYEPAIVIYVILTLFIVLNRHESKKDFLTLLILAAQIAIIGFYYILNSGAGEVELRGGLVTENIAEHTSVVMGHIYDIFTKYSYGIMKNGLKKGLLITLGEHKPISAAIAVISVIFGTCAAMCVKKRKFNLKSIMLGIILFFGSMSLNFLLNTDRIPIRLVYFSFIGAGIILDELFSLLPKRVGQISCGITIAFIAFVFTTAGVGEVKDYIQTSEFDTYITQQIIDLDTENNVTNPNKNTYVFGGQHYYEESKCIGYLDHIRGASGNYADVTGCMRHLTGTPYTNNILTFTYGDSHYVKSYFDTEGLCSFYNVEYDKTVVKVDVVKNGDGYDVVRPDGSSAGRLVSTDGQQHQFFN